MSNIEIVNGKLCIDGVQLNEIIHKLKVVKEVYENNASRCVTDCVIKQLQGYADAIGSAIKGLESINNSKSISIVAVSHIIEGGIDGDKAKIEAYTNRVADDLEYNGDSSGASKLRASLKGKSKGYKNRVTLDSTKKQQDKLTKELIINIGKPAEFGLMRVDGKSTNRYVSTDLSPNDNYFAKIEARKTETLKVTKDANNKDCIIFMDKYYYSIKDFCTDFSIPVSDVFQLFSVGYDEETILKHFLGLLGSKKTLKLAEVLQNFNVVY